ncbi:hypothetical protein [Ramlibacter humi]|uniref:Uncharacterized protein n=1 Tax=Ramlibacter humi TaxID=2530451 RepID=A0A4Z0CDF1_9BURK|nr:hypothetical protein [Ramlibacter humi]TFZ08538.1 hypothetical protein EZ216_05110 [Ramlibacter humi]
MTRTAVSASRLAAAAALLALAGCAGQPRATTAANWSQVPLRTYAQTATLEDSVRPTVEFKPGADGRVVRMAAPAATRAEVRNGMIVLGPVAPSNAAVASSR